MRIRLLFTLAFFLAYAAAPTHRLAQAYKLAKPHTILGDGPRGTDRIRDADLRGDQALTLQAETSQALISRATRPAFSPISPLPPSYMHLDMNWK